MRTHSSGRPAIAPRHAALAMALAFAAQAQAQVINIPWSATFVSSIVMRGYPSDGTCLNVYTAPTKYKLRITDYTLDSYGATMPLPFQYICTGHPTCAVAQSAYMTAPVGTMVTQSFTTGILVNAGDTLSLCNYSGTGRPTSWTLHGFLYTTP